MLLKVKSGLSCRLGKSSTTEEYIRSPTELTINELMLTQSFATCFLKSITLNFKIHFHNKPLQ